MVHVYPVEHLADVQCRLAACLTSFVVSRVLVDGQHRLGLLAAGLLLLRICAVFSDLASVQCIELDF